MNNFIGDPIVAIKNYANSKEHRSISEMTIEECRLILDIASDNGEWKSLAVSNVEITSTFSNFVEGIFYFGSNRGESYNFSIRYDGTVRIYQKIKDSEGVIIEIKNCELYNFTRIVILMMKMGFNITQDLL